MMSNLNRKLNSNYPSPVLRTNTLADGLNPLPRKGNSYDQDLEIIHEVLPLKKGGDIGGAKFGRGLILLVLFLVVSLNCSRSPEVQETFFSATITVADSIDQTGDYSGFEFLIFNRENITDPIDTLLYATTDSTGALEDIIKVEQAGIYPVQLSRYGTILASFRVVIAENDTIRFSGEFPDFTSTFNVDSREQRAIKVFDRVDAGYNRVSAFVAAGQFPQEDLPAELQKWADLYWEVFEGHEGTLAAKFALESAVTVLNMFDQPQMFQKLQGSYHEVYAFGLAATLGKEYVANLKGIEASVSYLDSVKALTKDEGVHQAIDQTIVKLYLDSLQVETSKELLASYEKEYEDEENYSFWYKNLRFELYELTPGEPAPEFSFITTEGDTVTNESLKGKPVILEFTEMVSSLYQAQYDEAALIFQLFAEQGLQYYTIPFDESAVTIISFFDERDRYWSLADPPSFNKKEMVDDFNIQYYPTRILIDADGNIFRKYIGEEFDGIIPGINETLTN